VAKTPLTLVSDFESESPELPSWLMLCLTWSASSPLHPSIREYNPEMTEDSTSSRELSAATSVCTLDRSQSPLFVLVTTK
jgi:hypothetical protein